MTSSYSSHYSSTSANTAGSWLAVAPSERVTISSVVLHARMHAGVPNGFPASYSVYITDSTNASWVQVGAYQLQPQSNGEVVIDIPWGPTATYGAWIVPNVLGVDINGNHYFQMADITFQ